VAIFIGELELLERLRFKALAARAGRAAASMCEMREIASRLKLGERL
jgi:hypothetical protein